MKYVRPWTKVSPVSHMGCLCGHQPVKKKGKKKKKLDLALGYSFLLVISDTSLP